MENLVNIILDFLQSHKELGYILTFIFAGLESTPFIGVVSPGTVIMLTIGLFVSQDIFNIYFIIIAASFGSLLGDILSYFIGMKFGDKFGKKVLVEFTKTAEEFFEKHGDKSILIGKFIGPIRAMLPFFAGYSKMKFWKFFIFASIGSVIWASTYLILGYLFGNAINEIEKVMSGVSIALLIIFVVLIIVYIVRNEVISIDKKMIKLFVHYFRKLINLFK